MDGKFGPYDVKAEAIPRGDGSGFEAHWVVSWIGAKGIRQWANGSRGVFSDELEAKAVADAELEGWLRAQPLPPP